MDRFNIVANLVADRLAGLAEWVWGCGHNKTTFPMTPRRRLSGQARNTTPSETYIVCLDCGRQFAYDWTAMRIARRRATGIAETQLASEARVELQ